MGQAAAGRLLICYEAVCANCMQFRSGIFYTSFKYAMYALLLINTFYFYESNAAAEEATGNGVVALKDLIVVYADAIDSGAWLLLLLLYEIETSYTPPARHEKWIQPLIASGTVLCWAVIVYSFYGYVGGLGLLNGFAGFSGGDPCSLAGTGALFAETLDDYPPLDAENCRFLSAGALYNSDVNLFASPEKLSLIKKLIWTDIVNAGTWIIVAGIIELEIFMRVTHRATTKFLKICNIVKAPFWAILVIAVLYWWRLGEPIESWDASLWIIAFFFIELNMIAKHEERVKRRAKSTPA